MTRAALSDQGAVWREYAEAGGERWAAVASGLGRLVAQGLIGEAEALTAMLDASRARRPDLHESSRRMLLAQALGDAVRRWERARDRVRFGIRRALNPMLTARAPSTRLLAAADAVNGDAGEPLLAREVRAEVVREVYWASRRLAREGKLQ